MFEATKYEIVEIEIGIEEKEVEAEVEIGRANVAGLSHQTGEIKIGELLIFVDASCELPILKVMKAEVTSVSVLASE